MSNRVGIFEISNRQVWSSLDLESSPLSITLYFKESDFDPCAKSLLGQSPSLEKISCIDCIYGGKNRTWRGNESSYSLRVTPHYALIGASHFDVECELVAKISFSITDIDQLFDDSDAYGELHESSESLRKLIPPKIGNRNVPSGDHPRIAYFAGRTTIIRVELLDSVMEVGHTQFGGSSTATGLPFGSSIRVSLSFKEPLSLQMTIRAMLAARRFFSLIGGRRQGVTDIKILKVGAMPHEDLDLRMSFPPEGPKEPMLSNERPWYLDIPLDAVRRPDEFTAVAQAWFARDVSWLQSRSRYQGCLENDNYYDVDRLVAAANMFDLLPHDAAPAKATLDPALVVAQKQCRTILRALPETPERDSALLALGLMSRASLTKKVQHRSKLISQRVGHLFPKLEDVCRRAVQLRNYYVHGTPPKDMPIEKLQSFSTFLTSTLEFVFATSDLVEAGWNISSWVNSMHSANHSFVRYRLDYPDQQKELLG
jgi:hypothetical protein